MPRKNPHCAPLALTPDGGVLINLSGQLDQTILARVAQALAVKPGDLFIGTRLPPAQRAQALVRIDDAAAEVVARILGEATPPAPSQPGKKRARAR